MRARVDRSEPAGRIEMESLGDARCSRTELRRKGRQHLELGCAHHGAKSELCSWAGQARHEQRLRLVRREAGQPRPIAVDQTHSAAGTSLGVDRHAGLAQGVDVAVNRPNRHFELLGQLTGRQATTRLQEEQDVDQSTGAHLPISIARLLTVHVRKRPIAPQASQWRRELKRRPNRGWRRARPRPPTARLGLLGYRWEAARRHERPGFRPCAAPQFSRSSSPELHAPFDRPHAFPTIRSARPRGRASERIDRGIHLRARSADQGPSRPPVAPRGKGAGSAGRSAHEGGLERRPEP